MPSDKPLNICLIEPFYSGSHAYWADRLVEHSKHNISLITMPGHSWRKRMRESGKQLVKKVNKLDTSPDVILVSSMTNAAELRNGLRAELSEVPFAIYMHENQFGYPGSKSGNKFGAINWQSIEAADQVFVNSEFHKNELADLTKKNYGNNSQSEMTKVQVLSVGIDPASGSNDKELNPPLVLFNHRWEFDKNPALAIEAFNKLASKDIDFELALLGEHYQGLAQYGNSEQVLRNKIRYEGYLSEHEYKAVLNKASVVLSTASHEYFGISIAEATLSGAIPVVPNDLNYPFLIPSDWHDLCLYDLTSDKPDTQTVADSLEEVLNQLNSGLKANTLFKEMTKFVWPNVIDNYDSALAELTNRSTT